MEQMDPIQEMKLTVLFICAAVLSLITAYGLRAYGVYDEALWWGSGMSFIIFHNSTSDPEDQMNILMSIYMVILGPTMWFYKLILHSIKFSRRLREGK